MLYVIYMPSIAHDTIIELLPLQKSNTLATLVPSSRGL